MEIPTWVNTVVSIGALVGGPSGGWIVVKYAGRQAKVKAQLDEQELYQRIVDMVQKELDKSNAKIVLLEAEIAKLKTDREGSDMDVRKKAARITLLESDNRRLRARITKLESVMINAGMMVPPHE